MYFNLQHYLHNLINIIFDHLSIQFQEESVSGMAARRCSVGMEDRRGHEEAIRRFLRRIEDTAPDEPDGQGKEILFIHPSKVVSFYQPRLVKSWLES